MKCIRNLSLVMIFSMVFSFPSSTPVHAQDNSKIRIVTPFYNYTNKTVTDLNISGAGTATATASITGYQGIITKVQINMYLEQYNNGSWKSVKSWSQTDNSYRGTLQDTYTVSSGYNYRVRASYYAYSGSKYENIVSYSSEYKY